MSDSVGQYLNEIGMVPLLTAEEERNLSQTIEKGREAQERLDAGERPSRELRRAIGDAAAAKDRFIRANLRLVVSIARRYPLPPSMELLDLIQEGNLGLEHAVDKFDWRKGFKFSTYATFWIRQAIGRALDQKASLVRLPGDRSASLRAALRHASGEGADLDDEHARLHRLTTPTSLDRTVGDDPDGSELVDLLADSKPGPEAHHHGPRRGRVRRPGCSTCSSPGPATPSSSASASTTAAPAATARSARSSASPPRPPAASSSGPSARCAKKPAPAAPPDVSRTLRDLVNRPPLRVAVDRFARRTAFRSDDHRRARLAP